MPLLRSIRSRFADETPFAGRTIGVSLHLEPKTAALLNTLRAGGAEVVATGNFGSTQDDVVAALRASGVRAIGARDDTWDRHLDNVRTVAADHPDLLLDNGADLAAICDPAGIEGGTEETTSGANRLRSELDGSIPYPVIVINDSPLKAIVENQHGVGQSVLESIQRITNLMIQGKRIAVFGYGWCGRGIAHYARQLGAFVEVVEPDPIKALEAAMLGFGVARPAEAVEWANVVITATGAVGVVDESLFGHMTEDVLLVNAGHFPDEIDVSALRARTRAAAGLSDGVERLTLDDGTSVRLVAGGRMVNLAGIGAKGNSIEAMDLGFALQSLSLERIARSPSTLEAGAQPVPDDINASLARAFTDMLGGRTFVL